jgi:hypothetical protein
MTQQINTLLFKTQVLKQEATLQPAVAQQPAPAKSSFGSKVQDYLFPKETPGVYNPAGPTKPRFSPSGPRREIVSPVQRGVYKLSPNSSPGGPKRVGQLSGRGAFAIGPGVLMPYGTGMTLSSTEKNNWGKTGVANTGTTGKLGAVAAGGEVAFGQVRSRKFVGITSGIEAQASLVNANYGVTYDTPALTLGGTRVLQLKTDATVEGFVGSEGRAYAGFTMRNWRPAVEVGVEAFAGARTTIAGSANLEVGGLDVSAGGYGQATAGATATAVAKFGKGGVQATAGAFAGASATAGGSYGVGGVATAPRIAVWAGVGAKASAKATISGGTFKGSFELGAAIGIGGSISVGVEVDLTKMAKNAGRLYNVGAAVSSVPAIAKAFSGW